MPLNPDYVYEIKVTGIADGQEIVNVFHYRVEVNGGPITANLQDLVASFATKWEPGVITALSEAYVLQRYEGVEIVGSTPGTPIIPGHLLYGSYWIEDGAGSTGGQPATFNSTFDAATLRKITNVRSRFYRGGCRLGPPSDADVVDNKLTVAALGRFQTAANNLDDTITAAALGANYVPVVFSRRLATTQLLGTTVPGTYTAPIITVTPSPFISSQVSRKRRRVGA